RYSSTKAPCLRASPRCHRANAQKPTGPRAPEEKRRSALNATRHGILSQVLYLEEELRCLLRLHVPAVIRRFATLADIRAFMGSNPTSAGIAGRVNWFDRYDHQIAETSLNRNRLARIRSRRRSAASSRLRIAGEDRPVACANGRVTAHAYRRLWRS